MSEAELIHNRACFLSHMGDWMMKEDLFNSISSLIISGNFKFPERPAIEDSAELHGRSTGEERVQLLPSGILIVPIVGMTMPKASKWGGTSTIILRHIVREATFDPNVKGIMQKVGSPGGLVEGTHITAQAFAEFAKVKPLFTHTEEMMASAAIWIGLQSSRVSASPMATVGSLGTVGIVHDSSKRFEKAGVKTIVLSTGKFKGMGSEGSEFTQEQIDFMQARVDEKNEFFKTAIMEARGFTREKTAMLFDGSFGLAQKAFDDGLIDKVESFSEALSSLEDHINGEGQNGNSNQKSKAVAGGIPSATMETLIKQNKSSEKEIDKMEDPKNVAELKAKYPSLCSEMEQSFVDKSATATAEVIASAKTEEDTRVGDWMTYIDVDPKAVRDGVESGKCIGIPQATELAIKRTDPAFKAALVEEGGPDAETPSDEALEGDSETKAILAAAENLE